MQKSLLLILIILFFVGCGSSVKHIQIQKRKDIKEKKLNFKQGMNLIVQRVKKRIVKKSKIKIAVLNFANQDNNLTSLGVKVSKTLTAKFRKLKKFDTMKRKHFISVLNFNNISAHGNISKKMMEEIAWMLDFDIILTGNIRDLNKNELEVDSKIFMAKSGKLLDKYVLKIQKNKKLITLHNKVLKPNPRADYKIFTINKDENDITLSPRKKREKDVFILKQKCRVPIVKKIRF